MEQVHEDADAGANGGGKWQDLLLGTRENAARKAAIDQIRIPGVKTGELFQFDSVTARAAAWRGSGWVQGMCRRGVAAVVLCLSVASQAACAAEEVRVSYIAAILVHGV